MGRPIPFSVCPFVISTSMYDQSCTVRVHGSIGRRAGKSRFRFFVISRNTFVAARLFESYRNNGTRNHLVRTQVIRFHVVCASRSKNYHRRLLYRSRKHLTSKRTHIWFVIKPVREHNRLRRARFTGDVSTNVCRWSFSSAALFRVNNGRTRRN